MITYFQQNDFINVDKKYLDTFLSKKRGYKKVLWRQFFEITLSLIYGVLRQSILYYCYDTLNSLHHEKALFDLPLFIS